MQTPGHEAFLYIFYKFDNYFKLCITLIIYIRISVVFLVEKTEHFKMIL